MSFVPEKSLLRYWTNFDTKLIHTLDKIHHNFRNAIFSELKNMVQKACKQYYEVSKSHKGL